MEWLLYFLLVGGAIIVFIAVILYKKEIGQGSDNRDDEDDFIDPELFL